MKAALPGGGLAARLAKATRKTRTLLMVHGAWHNAPSSFRMTLPGESD
ncbi:hypothetical protein [Corallococcus aberystwythensis]|nr:hypothetical protein [Corallococcus aberystwythensis]